MSATEVRQALVDSAQRMLPPERKKLRLQHEDLLQWQKDQELQFAVEPNGGSSYKSLNWLPYRNEYHVYSDHELLFKTASMIEAIDKYNST